MIETLVIIMGVAGCGKSTVAAELAVRLDWPFIEGDAHHPPSNIEKMQNGLPLQDSDRDAWIDSILSEVSQRRRPGLVLACSALTPHVQSALLRAEAKTIRWILLEIEPALARKRMQNRTHFMPAALLDSQFAALAPPRHVERFSADQPVRSLVDQIEQTLLG